MLGILRLTPEQKDNKHLLDVTDGKVYKVNKDAFKSYILNDKGRYICADGFTFEKHEEPIQHEKIRVKLTPAQVLVDRKKVLETCKCFTVQEGGSHYTSLQLQPLEATYLRYGLDGLKAAIHTKVDKYICRKKDDEVGQYRKASHCLDILIEVTEAEKEYVRVHSKNNKQQYKYS